MFYRQVEHFTVVDALYFSAMTLTKVRTVALAPHTDPRKIGTVIYAFAGIGVIFGVIYYIAKGIRF